MIEIFSYADYPSVTAAIVIRSMVVLWVTPVAILVGFCLVPERKWKVRRL